MRPPAGRSASRMSVGSKHGGGSKVAEDDGKTSVKVGEYKIQPFGSEIP